MSFSFSARLAAVALGLAILVGTPAFAIGLDPAYDRAFVGPEQAKGVVVWSHGRSIDVEDSESPIPPYLRVMRDSGWDVMRFDRLRDGDTLPNSTKRLVGYVSRLKQQGYKRVVLAGQSFGGFLALMAADASAEVDAVVATSPAAYGSFDEFYNSWQLNATRLYPLIEGVQHARVMLFYFHGDDFDPGGRGEHSRAILSARGLGYSINDQPAFLTTHWASSTGLFMRRFGECIRDFAEADGFTGEYMCRPSWGQHPSADLKLPDELVQPTMAAQPASASPSVLGGSGEAAPATRPAGAVLDTWYGFYPNGREVVLAIDRVHNEDLGAVYAIGPGIDDNEPSEWTRRDGHIVDDEFVFEKAGRSTLRFRPLSNGGLAATWTSADGQVSMSAGLRRIDPAQLAAPHQRTAEAHQPQ